jgi:hypothetical protein
MRADKRGWGELEVEPLFTLHGSLTNMNVLDMIDAIWPRGRVCCKLHSPDKAIISCLQLILMTRSPYTAAPPAIFLPTIAVHLGRSYIRWAVNW